MKLTYQPVLYMLAMFLTLSSCVLKDKSCEDEDLSIQRTNYLANDLKTKGYFYRLTGTDAIDIVILYKNGVVIKNRVTPADIILFETELVNNDFIKKIKRTKFYWGVFSANTEHLAINHWAWQSCGNASYMDSCKIISDSSFVHYKAIYIKDKTVYPLNDTFRFKAFSPKPDSTNSFIQ